ncbi:MAG: hypothetical protein R6U15_01330 [Candidatus Izemoplasmatales bacterium]
MKFKKLFIFTILLGFSFLLIGCNAAKTAQNRLEDAGYIVESGDEDEVSNELSQYGIENITNIYLVYDDEDDSIPNAIIVEYESEEALENEILGEDESKADYEDMIYKNLFVISLEVMNQDNIIDIIKGD